MINRFDTVGLL